jgi:hypothetical protein
MLSIVPVQLLLFAWRKVHSWRPFPAGQMLRDQRTARQWIDSVTAYCEWRAGESWRCLSDSEQRNDPERWAYLDAIRLILSQQYVLERPLLVQPATPDPLESEIQAYAGWPREALVDVLLMLDRRQGERKLTNRRLLKRLHWTKLARLIVECERSQRAERKRA